MFRSSYFLAISSSVSSLSTSLHCTRTLGAIAYRRAAYVGRYILGMYRRKTHIPQHFIGHMYGKEQCFELLGNIANLLRGYELHMVPDF